MQQQANRQWGTWDPSKVGFPPSNVVQLHQEPAQLRIVIDFDVPGHLADSSAVWAALEQAKQLATAAVQSACIERLQGLGVKYIGASVERD